MLYCIYFGGLVFDVSKYNCYSDMRNNRVMIIILNKSRQPVRSSCQQQQQQQHAFSGKRRRGAVGSASASWSVDTCQSWVRAPPKAPVVSLSKKLYSHCLVLIGSRNGFERDLHKQNNCLFHNRTKIKNKINKKTKTKQQERREQQNPNCYIYVVWNGNTAVF